MDTLRGGPCAGQDLLGLLLGDVALTLSTIRAVRDVATATGPTEAAWDLLDSAAAIERALWARQAEQLDRDGHYEAA